MRLKRGRRKSWGGRTSLDLCRRRPTFLRRRRKRQKTNDGAKRVQRGRHPSTKVGLQLGGDVSRYRIYLMLPFADTKKTRSVSQKERRRRAENRRGRWSDEKGPLYLLSLPYGRPPKTSKKAEIRIKELND